MLKNIISGLLLSSSSITLASVPPSVQFHSEAKALLESDPCLTVKMIPSPKFSVAIQACHSDKARALAQLLRSDAAPSTPSITIFGPEGEEVYDTLAANLSAEDLARVFDTALHGNALYATTHTSHAMGRTSVFVEFKPVVVQWFTDDMTEWSRYKSMVAADAFDDLFHFSQYEARGIYTWGATARQAP